MSLVISSPTVTELRFDAIYAHSLNHLMNMDPVRFRGLGKTHCKSFVRESLAFCDAHKITFKEHIEYVHFIMYFVGTGFPRDPRYTALTAALIDQSRVAHIRIDMAHRIFRQFGERFIGVGLEHTKAALATFHEITGTLREEQMTPRRIFDAFYTSYNLTPQERDAFPEAAMVQAAQHSATELDVETPLGLGVTLSLALWLGNGFAKDPLFPWIRDIPAEPTDTAHERARALHSYAIKRMTKMLPSKEI